MSFIILLKAVVGLLAAAGLVAAVGLLCLHVPEYWLAIVLGVFFGMVVLACLQAKKFKETEGESGGVVYIDYYDVFKCLSVAVVPVVIFFLGIPFLESQGHSILIFCGLYVGLMLLHIAYKTAQYNNLIILPVMLLVKFGLSIIWITVFYQMLNPVGKTRESRRHRRAVAVILMMLITPLISLLVLGDEGKGIVQARLHGRRFAGASTLRKML